MEKSIYETQKEIDEKFKSLVVADKNQLMIISKKNEQLTKMFEELSLAKKNMKLLDKMIKNHRSEMKLIEERQKLAMDNPDLFDSDDPVKSSLEWWNGDDEPSKIIDLYTAKLAEHEKISENISNLISLTQSTLLRILDISKNKASSGSVNILPTMGSTNASINRRTGIVKCKNPSGPFGFIIDNFSSTDLYMHKCMFDVENEFDTICAGDLVEYEIRKADTGNCPKAVSIKVLKKTEKTETSANKSVETQKLTPRRKRLKKIKAKQNLVKSKSTNDLSASISINAVKTLEI